MKKEDSKYIVYGYLYALAATLFWSGNFTVARGLIESIPPVTLAFWRWTTAVIVLTPIAIKVLVKDWAVVKNNLRYLTITSIFGVTLFNTLIYIASHTTTALNLSLIAITFPVFIIIFSRFLYNEAITANKWSGIILVILGITTLITKGDFSILKNLTFARGDLWMLLAAITFAIYSILVKQKPSEIGTRTFQLSTFLIGLFFLTPFYIWESSITNFQIQYINNTTLYSILYIGIFASLFSYVLWGKAVESIGPSKSSIIYYMLPVFSGILAYIFLGEKIESIHFISMSLIIFGVITAIYTPKAA